MTELYPFAVKRTELIWEGKYQAEVISPNPRRCADDRLIDNDDEPFTPQALHWRAKSRTKSIVPSLAPNAKDFCRAEIDRMLKNSQTKVIAPVITFGL